jgi:hypothetical protein
MLLLTRFWHQLLRTILSMLDQLRLGVSLMLPPEPSVEPPPDVHLYRGFNDFPNGNCECGADLGHPGVGKCLDCTLKELTQ